MKKFVSTLLAGAMVFGLAACGSPSNSSAAASAASEAEEGSVAEETTTTEETTAAAVDMKIAMITDYGDITDQSFNQTTYEAAKAFAEANGCSFTYYKPAGDSTPERVAMVDKAVADGYNVLVMPGYAFGETVAETADMYPDVKFVALDVSEGDLGGYVLGDNVFTAVYQEEIAGYFAGVAAVKLGYTKLGFLGGMAVPAVIRYGYGFVQGASDAAGDLGITVDINYAYGNQFFGDGDITAAMDTWYQGGTEVVFACGGGIFTSAAEAAAKVGGKVIGVDVDQKGTIDGNYGDGLTVTSAMKGLAATVDTVLSAIRDGNWADYSGQTINLGLVSATDPTQNFVQLPASTQWADGFTEADYNALVADVFNGKVTVSNDISAEQPTADNANINFQGNIK